MCIRMYYSYITRFSILILYDILYTIHTYWMTSLQRELATARLAKLLLEGGDRQDRGHYAMYLRLKVMG